MKCNKILYHGKEYNRKAYYDIEFYVYRTTTKVSDKGIQTICHLCDENGNIIGWCYLDEVTYTNETKEIDVRTK